MRVAVALLLAAVGLSAGCGGGGDSNSGAAKRAIEPEAQKRAASMVLRLNDFPVGWRASAPDPDNSGQAKFRKCLGVDYSTVEVTGDAQSRDFETGQTTEASSEAHITATPDQAQEQFEQAVSSMSGPKLKDCVKKLLPRSSEYKVGDVDAGELRIASPGNVEKTKAWQVVIPLEVTSGASKGITATAYVDLVALLSNDAIATVTTFAVLAPFDPTLRDQLVETVAGRMT